MQPAALYAVVDWAVLLGSGKCDRLPDREAMLYAAVASLEAEAALSSASLLQQEVEKRLYSPKKVSEATVDVPMGSPHHS